VNQQIDRAARRRGRTGGVAAVLAVSIALLYAAVTMLGPFAIRVMVRTLELTLDAIVWLILTAQSGFGTWGTLGRAGRTILGTLGTSQVTTALVGIEVVAAIALYALYRMLSQEKE
jgi:hypothetical protein